MIKTFRYRLYPTNAQERILEQQFAICCELYNAALQERRDAWKYQRKPISYIDQTKQLTHIKPLREDVAGVSANVLENVLKRVQLAFEGFFRRVEKGPNAGYPRFRSARRYDSLTFRQIGNAIHGNRLRLSKIGKIRIKLHRPLEGAVKTLTVKREAGRWLASFVVECEVKPLPACRTTTGIDVGITTFATFSDGSTIENPRYYEVAQKRLRVAARKVTRRRKGSKRRRKAVMVLQRACVHVRNQRTDFHHKLSRVIVNSFGLIAVEDLNVKGLAQSSLSKQINDAGWSNFINKLCAKAEEAARIVVKVNPSGTSQICTCGARVEKTLTQRWHECSACGLSAPRDHVSAQIILARGLRVQALTSPVAECVA